jgi:calcineurin-like phosphoesterase family protein
MCVALVAASIAAGCGSDDPAAPPAGPAGEFRPPAPARSATVWAVGDGDASPAGRAVARLIRRGRPTRLLYLGDVYDTGSASDFREQFAPSYGRLRRRTLPTPGNHDWPQHADGYDPYWKAVAGGRPPSHYAVSIAGWRIISLNSEEPMGPGSEQGRWLARRLTGKGTCRIAFWHRPRYSAGLHGDQPDIAPLWTALRGHAALVVNGHDHDMQHFRRHDGITQLVAGSGGHGIYPVRPDPRLVWSDDQHFGALRIRLRRGRAALAFVSTAGRVLHRTAASCRR